MLRLYDTRRRAKVAFEPADPGRVTMYVCGPTVYGRAHIGNARPAVVFDVLFRLLRHIYGADNVVYARNITDIDDKIIAAAAAEGVDPVVIAERYEAAYNEDIAALGCLPPTITPRATEHVPHMIAMAERLIARGVAYAAEGHVLFSVAADPGYGSLSRRDAAAMQAGARVEVAPYKRDAGDFVLWKPSGDDQPGWDSPWGRGRPGWHLECSAMIREHLGETIDIHAGGQDLIFPHHENEAAQSRCAHDGAELARVWMHNGFLSMGADKMSKSLGNVVSVGELLEQGWDGEVIRLALLSAHYRQPLEWTEGLLKQSSARHQRLNDASGFIKRHGLTDTAAHASPATLSALIDDINSPEALAALSEPIRRMRFYDDDAATAAFDDNHSLEQENVLIAGSFAHEVVASARLLGLMLKQVENEGASASVVASITARLAARAARDFGTADRIRDELAAEGIVLEDRPDGTTDWRRA